jgi:hypothetical protein
MAQQRAVAQTNEQDAGEAPAAQQNSPQADAQPQRPQPTREQLQEMMEIWGPGENHKPLDFFVGKWDTVTKMYMGGPGSQAMESTGTTEVKWVLGKRYIQETHKGELMGMPYEGLGMIGYDNAKNLYVGSWYSNMSTEVLTYKGARDPSGKKFTYYGEMDEPMIKVFGRTVKYVTTILSDDQYRLDVIDLHAGDDYKVIEIVYTRQKSAE